MKFLQKKKNEILQFYPKKWDFIQKICFPALFIKYIVRNTKITDRGQQTDEIKSKREWSHGEGI